MKNNSILTLIVAFAVSSFSASAGDVTVDPGGGGDHTTIQAAIDDVNVGSGDTVWLVDTTYSGDGNYDLDFRGKEITVRSMSDDPTTCVIDCGGAGRGFYFHSVETASSAVRGLTVSGGFGTEGSGMYCEFSSPTIENCSHWKNGFCLNMDWHIADCF